jgi:spore coat protein U-like protein
LATIALALLPLTAAAAPSCSAVVMTGLTFGTYDVFSAAPLTSTARIRLSCPKGQAPQITISPGSNSTTFRARRLSGGTPGATDFLEYNVYQDAAMRVVWGDGTDGSAAWVSPTGNAQLLLYGRIPAGQDVASGNYTDALTVTVFL